MRLISCLLTLALVAPLAAQTPSQAKLDHDLLEVTVPQLQALYARHRYTVTQWYLARIAKYNGIYRSLQTVDSAGALKAAAAEDAEPSPDFARQPLWGVPMLIKANTSIQGLVTSDGWEGFQIPGHELREAEQFSNDFGPPKYRTIDDYAKAVGTPLPSVFTAAAAAPSPPPRGGQTGAAPAQAQQARPEQAILNSDPNAEKTFWGPQRVALVAYDEALDRLHLDALVLSGGEYAPRG